MEITRRSVGDVTVISLSGELDGKTAPTAQEQLTPICQPGCRLVLDMHDLTYMSSAGLRLMLLIYRQVSAGAGKLALAGLSEDLQNTMSATGFLTYFTTVDTVDAAVAAVE